MTKETYLRQSPAAAQILQSLALQIPRTAHSMSITPNYIYTSTQWIKLKQSPNSSKYNKTKPRDKTDLHAKMITWI